jgi:hypothetical protein
MGIREAAFATQGEVAALASRSGQDQVPGVYSQILGEDIHLTGPSQAPPAAAGTTRDQGEQQAFLQAMQRDDIAAIDDFLSRYPTGMLPDLARRKREILERAQSVQSRHGADPAVLPRPSVPPQQRAVLEPPPIPKKPGPAARSYIIPASSSRLLNAADLSGLTPAELRVARNEIFARNGRFMQDAALRAYFSQFAWYKPYTWDITLTPIEKANVGLIQKAEGAR